jgi:L-asparaginase
LYTVKNSISRTFVRLDNAQMTNFSNTASTILILGTGGTIAGLANGTGEGAYLAGQVPVARLLNSIKSKFPLKNIQLCNIDSCDMTEELLTEIGNQVIVGIKDPSILGLVITHGTDTLEETALFLELTSGHLAKNINKKVVLTGAMLPSDHPNADGPLNLSQAIHLLGDPTATSGIWAVMGAKRIPAIDLAKRHTSKLDAFAPEDTFHLTRNGSEDLPVPPKNHWPWVEIVTSHAGAKPEMVAYMHSIGVEGIVLAGTGGGTVHKDLAGALEAYMKDGGAVVRSSRIGQGSVSDQLANGRLAKALGAGYFNPAKARLALQLALYASQASRANPLSWQDIFAKIVNLPKTR